MLRLATLVRDTTARESIILAFTLSNYLRTKPPLVLRNSVNLAQPEINKILKGPDSVAVERMFLIVEENRTSIHCLKTNSFPFKIGDICFLSQRIMDQLYQYFHPQ